MHALLEMAFPNASTNIFVAKIVLEKKVLVENLVSLEKHIEY